MFHLSLLQTIPLDLINTTSHWSLHPFLDDVPPPALQQSFEEVGVLHPPVVQQAPNGRYDLICGRRRLRALKDYFKQTSFLCLLLPPAPPPDFFFLYILTDQQLNAPLSPMEKAFLLQYCLKKMEEKAISSFILPRLGYPKHPHLIQQLTSLLILEDKIQQQVHKGFIADKIAFDLLALTPTDRLYLSSLFELLQPGTGKQKRILSLSQDIARRSRQSISSLFDEIELRDILEHQEMNAPQKTHSLLEILQKMSSPRSSAAEHVFKERVRRLDLPGNCEVTHSPNFEKDEVYLTLRFPDLGSCESACRNKEISLI